MNLLDVAYDVKAGREGTTVYYDKEKTCGAVLRSFGSPKYFAVRAKYNAPFEEELRLVKKAGDVAREQKIIKVVTAKALAEHVVVSLFGWEIPGENGLVSLGEITDSEVIEEIISAEEFEPLYTWILASAASSDNFKLDMREGLELAGKLRLGTHTGTQKTKTRSKGSNSKKGS